VPIPFLRRKETQVPQFVLPSTTPEPTEEEEALRTSIQTGTLAQVFVAIGFALAICYFAKLPLIVICISALLAFMLAPLVHLLERARLPRSVGAILSLLLLTAVLWGLTYFFYQRATSFAQELPHYSGKIKAELGRYRRTTEQLQKATESVTNVTAEPTPKGKQPLAVTVKSSEPGATGWIKDNFGTVSEVVLTASFIPFLTYFMLTGSEHTRRATVKLFPEEHRRAAYRAMGKVSDMMRAFIVGNLYIGLFISAISIVVYGFLGLPYFYFTGVLSGFLSVVPYLGVLLAVVPPLATGLGHLSVSHVLIVLGTVLGLHLFAMNVLYPKVLGKRLELNPLVVTLALLIWGWIWGAIGLILAVPIAAAIKILCDNVEQLKPIGEWMGEY
jgi:predicted PurR-regulated permease PerM